MGAYEETKRALKEHARLLRDAYYGRNGYSMSPAQRADYRDMMQRVRACRKIARQARGEG